MKGLTLDSIKQCEIISDMQGQAAALRNEVTNRKDRDLLATEMCRTKGVPTLFSLLSTELG